MDWYHCCNANLKSSEFNINMLLLNLALDTSFVLVASVRAQINSYIWCWKKHIQLCIILLLEDLWGILLIWEYPSPVLPLLHSFRHPPFKMPDEMLWPVTPFQCFPLEWFLNFTTSRHSSENSYKYVVSFCTFEWRETFICLHLVSKNLKKVLQEFTPTSYRFAHMMKMITL